MTIERRKEIEAGIRRWDLTGVTQEELDRLKSDWSIEISQAIYTAAGIIEKAENAGLWYGNGHHAAQEIARYASDIFEKGFRPRLAAGAAGQGGEDGGILI